MSDKDTSKELAKMFEKEKMIDQAVRALEEIDWLKITFEKLLADKPDREWIVERDFEKWNSVKIIRKAIACIKGEK
jgi:hypothetical protein